MFVYLYRWTGCDVRHYYCGGSCGGRGCHGHSVCHPCPQIQVTTKYVIIIVVVAVVVVAVTVIVSVILVLRYR